VSDPFVAAASEIIGDSLRDVRAAVEGLSPEGLNWRPPADDTNSIAVLVVHVLHTTRWRLSVATDAPAPDRDRPSEFAFTASDASELLKFVDEMSGDCLRLLADAGDFDAGASRTSRPSYRPPETVTAAWSLLHAVEHLREHVAHLQLTRQLWEARHSNG
jgi:hypothetical protein